MSADKQVFSSVPLSTVFEKETIHESHHKLWSTTQYDSVLSERCVSLWVFSSGHIWIKWNPDQSLKCAQENCSLEVFVLADIVLFTKRH